MPPKKKAAKKVPAKCGVRKMPPPMPKGAVLTDFTKKTSWTLGYSIGKGGFGEIYTASSQTSDGKYVIKIEPHENGPLFTELSFYRRVAKPDIISDWCKSQGLTYLSVPEFVAAGEHTHLGLRYRFMVMHQYGEDIEKKFTSVGRQFGMKTVCHLALRLLEALEFLHHSEYVHADVKGSNLLTGLTHPHQVYLVDYGLAYRYCPDGTHKEYSEDPRRKHDGTIEFTSIDAHKGVNPSRRADLEILGYCLLQWAAGRLPWEDHLEDKDSVARKKIQYRTNVNGLMTACFHDKPVPQCLRDYMRQVYKLEYTQTPEYTQLKRVFQRAGFKDDHKGLDWFTSTRKDILGLQRSSGVVGSPPAAKKRARGAAASRFSHPKTSAPKEEIDNESSVEDVLPQKKRAAVRFNKNKITSKEKDDETDNDKSVEKIPPPMKKAKAISSKRSKAISSKRSKAVSARSRPGKTSVDVIPKAAYPPELGYCNGEKSAKKHSDVSDEVAISPEPAPRRTRRAKR